MAFFTLCTFWAFSKVPKVYKMYKVPHVFFISREVSAVFSFHLSVFRFTKERLNTSIDTSKKNNNIKTHPLLSARDELELKICNFLNFFHDS